MVTESIEMVTEEHLNGNGGTHYHLSIQAIIIHHIELVSLRYFHPPQNHNFANLFPYLIILHQELDTSQKAFFWNVSTIYVENAY